MATHTHRLPAPGVPTLPAWELLPRSERSIPMGAAELPGLLPLALTPVLGPPPFIVPLTQHGYVEEEYLFSGMANVYNAEVTEVVQAGVPYVSRLLLWRPTDPAHFSGTVQLEPLRDATEATTVLRNSWMQLVRHGDIAVQFGMAAGNVGPMLKTFDAARYARIDLSSEDLRWDIFAQVAWLIKSPKGLLASLGYTQGRELKLISEGTSLTGRMQVLFMNHHHARARNPAGGPLIDAYIAGGIVTPLHLPTDAAVIRLNSEHEVDVVPANVPNLLAARRKDGDAPTDRYRLYEIAGMSHADPADLANYYAAHHQLGRRAPLQCKEQLAPLPGKELFNHAVMEHLDRWLRQGTPPPPGDARYIALNPDHSLKKDAHGNTVGGIRPYWVEVPTATIHIHSTNAGATGNCVQHKHQLPFEDSKLRALYPSDTYMTKVKAHLAKLVAEGYVLKTDVPSHLAAAAHNVFW